MKKFFRKLSGIFLCFLMLFSIAFVGIGEKSKNQENVSSGYNIVTGSEYYNDLVTSKIELESFYNLSEDYPLINEHQKDSLFCWIYSSMKSLESALMIQKGEYYNFSEIALAYLYYTDRVERFGSLQKFNVGGNFSMFYQCYQDYGLVLESDFSNDEYQYITQSNYRDYSYVSDYATKELNSAIKPYMLSIDSSYSALATPAKITIIKKFIKTYGAMFAAIEGNDDEGCFYENNVPNGNGIYDFYDIDRSAHVDQKHQDGYLDLNMSHAITIVGWNDEVSTGANETGAFLVMNSWGFESGLKSLFYVPYSYTPILATVSGFVCDSEPESITVDSASNSSFSTNIMEGSKKVKNIFCYDDEIWVNYKLNVSSLANVDVKISSGNKTYNGVFSISSDNATKTIKVKLANTASFYGGYYTISFYNNDVLLGKRGIFIYSGAEINYFKTRTDESLDTYALDNAFLNANNVATLNAPSIKNVGGSSALYLEFSRSPISNMSFVSLSNKAEDFQSLKMEVSDVQIVCSGNRDIEDDYTQTELIEGLFKTTDVNDVANVYRLHIGDGDLKLTQFENCLIKFKLTINSSVYEDCEREFLFNVFVSKRYSARTSNLFSIFYNLNGGENNEENITKYPRYSQVVVGDTIFDPNMTTIELLKPTKIGAVFVGWFLDEECTEQITKIDSTCAGNIKLYAKWEDLNTNYFDISLVLESARNNDNSPKSLSEDLVYGDSISVKFEFTKLSPMINNECIVQYFFFGTDVVDNYLNGTDTYKIFDLNFPELKAGSHTFSIKVKVLINGVLEVVEEAFLPVSVNKKAVTFGFSELTKTYNGQNQIPTVSMVDDFYSVDYQAVGRESLYNLVCDVEAKDAGIYSFYVYSLNNKNYTFDPESESSKCVFEIAKREISLSWKEYNQVYDGRNHLPEYEVVNIVPGDKVEFSISVLTFNNVGQLNGIECIKAGVYKVNILPESISNKNYTVSDVSDFEFEIKKSMIKIIMHSTTDRVQTKLEKRATPTFSVEGTYLSIEDLQINIITEARLATRSGKYAISCSLDNENYDYTVEKATYTLTGYYNVYYQLSNGKTYTERVEENKQPVGVTKKQLGVSKFSKISYSEDFVVNGEDIYVEVDYTDYSFIVYTAIIATIGAVIGLIIYIKKRGSNVR